jgi:hypothetical protein
MIQVMHALLSGFLLLGLSVTACAAPAGTPTRSVEPSAGAAPAPPAAPAVAPRQHLRVGMAGVSAALAPAFLKGYVESLYVWKADAERTKQLLADYLAFDPSAREEAQSLHETWVAYRDLLPEVPRATRAGLDLIYKERPPGTDENSGAGYAGLVDEGPLVQLQASGFFDEMRSEYRR